MIALFAARTEVEMGGESDSLRLQVLLQQLVRVAHCVRAQSLEVVRSEASQRVQSRNDKVQSGYFSLTLCDFFLEDDVSL